MSLKNIAVDERRDVAVNSLYIAIDTSCDFADRKWSLSGQRLYDIEPQRSENTMHVLVSFKSEGGRSVCQFSRLGEIGLGENLSFQIIEGTQTYGQFGHARILSMPVLNALKQAAQIVELDWFFASLYVAWSLSRAHCHTEEHKRPSRQEQGDIS